MVIDSFGGTPFLDNVGEEFMKKFFDAVSKLEMLRNEFFREDDPDSDKYYERYEEEIGDFFTKLRFRCASLKTPIWRWYQSADTTSRTTGVATPTTSWWTRSTWMTSVKSVRLP